MLLNSQIERSIIGIEEILKAAPTMTYPFLFDNKPHFFHLYQAEIYSDAVIDASLLTKHCISRAGVPFNDADKLGLKVHLRAPVHLVCSRQQYRDGHLWYSMTSWPMMV
jgi:hypothetical protein